MGLGSLLSSRIPKVDAIASIKQVGDNLFPGFGTIVIVISVLALISIMGVNAYGAMLTSVSGIDAFKKIKATQKPRVIGLVVIGIIVVVAALLIPDDYLSSFNNFVLLMLYFLVPWTAVNLTDYFFVRKGRYAIPHFFMPHGSVYGAWGARGLISYVIGFAAMVPFFCIFDGQDEVYVGPLARAIGSVDLAWLVGLLVSAIAYFLLARSLDMRKEEAVIAHIENTQPQYTTGDKRF
jgi:purine-cytosine permease-like protein